MRRAAKIAAMGSVLAVTVASAGWANVPVRVPTEGLPILDCAPRAPAPADSCLLRVPPLHTRDALTSEPVGEHAASFAFMGGTDPGFPEGLALSETLVLVDLTPGPGGGRRPTFEDERVMLRQIAEELPTGEPVAIYGFNEAIEKLLDFTTDRTELLGVVDDIALRGANTRISTFARDAIRVLEERDQTLLKTLLVISDGDEEGIDSIPEITNAAVEAGVSISAIGLFWRPVGTEENGAGMDYLRRLTEGSRGVAAQIQVRRPEAASAEISRFMEGLGTSLRNSGLIVPKGDARPADISLIIREPEIGDRASYVDRPLTAAFRPPPEPAEEEVVVEQEQAPPEPEPRRILGLAPPLAMGVGGVGLAAALAAVFLVARRRRSEPEMAQAENDYGPVAPEAVAEEYPEITETPDFAGPVKPRGPAAPVAAPAQLVVDTTGERFPIVGQRAAIGRAAENAVALADDSISRVHAELHRTRDGGYSVTDMQSLNGTFVNDRRIKGSHPVVDGDRLRFGDVEAKFTLH